MKTVECRADLHNHIAETEELMTTDSNGIVDHASNRLGRYGILGITNSRGDRRYQKFRENLEYDAKDLGNFVYIPEKELWVARTDEPAADDKRHLLFIGFDKTREIESEAHSVKAMLVKAKARGLVSILPHPIGGMGALETFEKDLNSTGDKFKFPLYFGELVSGIEIFNSQSSLWVPGVFPYHSNKKAQEFYELLARWTMNSARLLVDDIDLPKKVGALSFTDGHSVEEIGTCYTNLTMPHPDEITSNHLMVAALDEAIRNSQMLSTVDDSIDLDQLEDYSKGNWSPKVVKKFAYFDGKRKSGRLNAFIHSLKSVGLNLLGKKN